MRKKQIFEDMPNGSCLIPLSGKFINKDTGKPDVKFIPNDEVRYVLIKRIGEGTFGEVFKGYDKVSKTLVAIKFQKPNIDKQRHLRNTRLFEKEVKSLMDLKGNCGDFLCVSDYGIMTDKRVKVIYIVMNYIEGIELNGYIDNGNYKAKDVLVIMQNLLRGVRKLHSLGLAHQDIKPANVMINPKTLKVNIIDLGLICDELLCGNAGTPVYMPLMINMNSNLEVRQGADYWALGLILLEFIMKGSLRCESKCILRKRRSKDILKLYKEFRNNAKSGEVLEMIKIFDSDILRIFDNDIWDQERVMVVRDTDFTKEIKFGTEKMDTFEPTMLDIDMRSASEMDFLETSTNSVMNLSGGKNCIKDKRK